MCYHYYFLFVKIISHLTKWTFHCFVAWFVFFCYSYLSFCRDLSTKGCSKFYMSQNLDKSDNEALRCPLLDYYHLQYNAPMQEGFRRFETYFSDTTWPFLDSGIFIIGQPSDTAVRDGCLGSKLTLSMNSSGQKTNELRHNFYAGLTFIKRAI